MPDPKAKLELNNTRVKIVFIGILVNLDPGLYKIGSGTQNRPKAVLGFIIPHII